MQHAYHAVPRLYENPSRIYPSKKIRQSREGIAGKTDEQIAGGVQILPMKSFHDAIYVSTTAAVR